MALARFWHHYITGAKDYNKKTTKASTLFTTFSGLFSSEQRNSGLEK
jgi:hypothetical protein